MPIIRITTLTMLFMLLAVLPSQPTRATMPNAPEPFSCANITEIPQIECESLVARSNNINRHDLDLLHSQTIISQPTDGLIVDPRNRAASKSFFQDVYMSTEGVEQNWNGDYVICNEGDGDPTFDNALLQHVNYFRAMAGIPANVTLNEEFSRKARKAALIMSTNEVLTHDPQPDLTCFSEEGKEGAVNSNLTYMNSWNIIGEQYIKSAGVSNHFVGQRRWVLHPQIETMGVGTVPAVDLFRGGSALWVKDGNHFNPFPETRDGHIAWPPSGFVPYQVTYPRWSFGHPNANYNNTIVTMTKNGIPINIVQEQVFPFLNIDVLAWVPEGLDSRDSWPKVTEDVIYNVILNNVVIDNISQNVSYTVTIFDGLDSDQPILTATPTPIPTFTLTPIPTATQILPDITATPTPTSPPTAIPSSTPSNDNAPYEPNNTCTQAQNITTNGIPQDHTFHTTSDTDWSTFTAPAPGTYRIEVTIPDDSRADVDLYYYTDCDGFHKESFTETFAPGARIDVEVEQTGEQFYIRVKNFDALQFGPDVTYHLSVRHMPSQQSDSGDQLIPGPAIVVAGRYQGADSVQDNIDQTALAAYDLFVAKGRTDSEIFFLTTNSTLDNVDGDATERNLKYGITTWAKEQLEKENVAQVLTLYLVDHGGPDEFYLDRLNQEILTPNDLDDWLSELEDTFPDLWVNVIIEACRAGSFIERRNGSISKPGRVIITSSSASYDAFVSFYGARFSDNFISFLRQEQNLGYSFSESRKIVQRFHSRQDPWIDADGDGEHNELEDVAEASRRGFAQAGTLGGEWPPYIAAVNVSSQGIDFAAEVRHKGGNQDIEAVWAVVYPPSYTPPTGRAPYEDDGELNEETLDVIEFKADGETSYVESEAYTNFTEVGVYRVVVHARDAKGLVAQPVTIEVDARYWVYLPMISR